MHCYLDNCKDDGTEATYYINVIYSVDQDTVYSDEYVCEKHIPKSIESFVEQSDVQIIEVEVKQLGRNQGRPRDEFDIKMMNGY